MRAASLPTVNHTVLLAALYCWVQSDPAGSEDVDVEDGTGARAFASDLPRVASATVRVGRGGRRVTAPFARPAHYNSPPPPQQQQQQQRPAPAAANTLKQSRITLKSGTSTHRSTTQHKHRCRALQYTATDAEAALIDRPADRALCRMSPCSQHRGEDPLRESEQIAQTVSKQPHTHKQTRHNDEEEDRDVERDETEEVRKEVREEGEEESRRGDKDVDMSNPNEGEGNIHPQRLHRGAANSRLRTSSRLQRGRQVARGRRTERMRDGEQSRGSIGQEERQQQSTAEQSTVQQPLTVRRGTRLSSMRIPDNTHTDHTQQPGSAKTARGGFSEGQRAQQEESDGQTDEQGDDGHGGEDTAENEGVEEDEGEEMQSESESEEHSADEEKRSQKRQNRKWTDSETQALIAGMDKFAQVRNKCQRRQPHALDTQH